MSADPLSDPLAAELRATAADEEDETFVYPSAALPITGLSRTVRQADGSDDGTTDDSGTTPKAWRGSARTASNPWRTSGAVDGDEQPLFASREELTGNPFASMESTQKTEEAPVAVEEAESEAGQADSAGLAKAVQKAAAEGDVPALESIFFPDPSPSSHPSVFSLANDVQLGTGMSPLMIAASRGKLQAVRFFVEKAGGIVDMEDAEGETALHKAAYRGHLSIIKYLLSATISASALTTPVSSRASSRSPSASSEAQNRPGGLANVEQADHDGWTALHGACSRGYLDIVRYLVEEGGATVDVQSKGGYTPLMNAASRGHLPVVKYLTTRKSPDPFVRNAHGETAYDVAAASFEVHICEVLSTYEAAVWARRRQATGDEGYDPLALHTTVAVIVHENQRLDLRLGTLAAGLATGAPSSSTSTPSTTGKVAFKASAISRNDNRAPWTVPPSSKGINSTGRHLAIGNRDEVGLPTVERPFEMVMPNPPSAGAAGSKPPTSTAERSHFWLSEWQVDLTQPSVDPSDGWSYATSFDAPADQWSAEKPQELERLLDPGVSGGGGLLKERVGIKWVRRRRWVRVCRRRLDRPPIGFADVDEEDDEEGLAATVGRGRDKGDYVARARYLAGTRGKRRDGDAASVRSANTDDAKAAGRAELMRTVAKIGRAVGELREGMLRDDDEGRRQEARTLVETLNARLEDLQQRLDQDDAGQDEEEEEEFHYPAPVDDAGPSDYFTRPALTATLSTTSSLGRVPDLTPQLSLAPDFRVPTHDQASTKATAPSTRRQRFPSAPPLSPIRVDRIDGGPRWERDADAPSCRRCSKKFSFFVRKHHCRRCGLVVCASCSSNEDKMDPHEVVVEPGGMGGEVIGMVMGGFVFRTCDPCHLALREEGRGREGVSAAAAAVAGTATAMGADGGVNDAASDVSDLSECPVCGFSLARLQTKGEQEDHVRMCLEEGGGTVQPTGRYLVFVLTEGSPLVGNECSICFESLSIGTKIGRLSCLCFFHAHCIGAWLSRGHGCPVHSSRYL